MNKDMTEQEYINFLNTIDILPKEQYEIIKRGVLQLNDDKKVLFKEIERLNNIINELEKYIGQEWYCFDNESVEHHVAFHILDKLKELKGDN